MSEHRQPALSHEEFLEEIHPGTVGFAEEIEREVGEDQRRVRYARQWLLAYRNDPSANPDHILYYEEEIRHIANKLENPHG